MWKSVHLLLLITLYSWTKSKTNRYLSMKNWERFKFWTYGLLTDYQFWKREKWHSSLLLRGGKVLSHNIHQMLNRQKQDGLARVLLRNGRVLSQDIYQMLNRQIRMNGIIGHILVCISQIISSPIVSLHCGIKTTKKPGPMLKNIFSRDVIRQWSGHERGLDKF